MESYWSIGKSNEKTQETLNFLRTQADLLGQETHGNVLAKFTDKRRSSTAVMQDALSQIAVDLNSVHEGENASKLYHRKEYEFYITDSASKYELSIFDIACNDEYPIFLKIDQSIAHEAKLKTDNDVESFQDFKQYFADILRTHKVNYVIRKLQQVAEENTPINLAPIMGK